MSRDSLEKALAFVDEDTVRYQLYMEFMLQAEKEELDEWYQKAIELSERLANPRKKLNAKIVRFSRLMNLGETETLFAEADDFLAEVGEGKNPLFEARFHSILFEVYHVKGQILEAFTAARRSLDLYTQLGSKGEMAKAQFHLALLHRDKGEIEQAQHLLDSSLVLLQPHDQADPEILVSILNAKGRILRTLTEYDSARFYYLKSAAVGEKHNLLNFLGPLYNNLGNIAHTTGKLAEALEHYIRSLEIKQEIGVQRSIAIAYHNIGAVRMDLKEYEKAEVDFEKSQELALATNFKGLQIHNHLKIGNARWERNDLAIAKAEHEKALELSNGMRYQTGIIEAQLALGKDHQKRNEFETAQEYFIKGLELAKAQGQKDKLAMGLVGVAETYIALSDQNGIQTVANRSYPIENLLLQSTQISEEIGHAANLETSLTALRTYYRDQKAFRKEAIVAEKYIAFKDSIFTEQQADAISGWETKYETAEKEAEIKLLEKENELGQIRAATQRNFYIGGTLIMLLLGGLAFGYLYTNNRLKRIQQIERLRTKISADLHDDVGSLLTGLAMQSEILAHSVPEASKPRLKRIEDLSRSAMAQMRDAVWAMDAQKDNWESLIDRMREFALETLATKEIAFSLQTEGIPENHALSGEIRQNIYLIFKEAITNVAKHSDGTEVGAGLTLDKQHFSLAIRDNGSTQVKDWKSSGQGTSNMKRRAESLNGFLDIHTENGYSIYLRGVLS
ncbi:MAG: histidine kinase [Bacteroidota bacterium]